MQTFKMPNIYLIILSFCLLSCKKDKETQATIIGKWSVRSYVITNFENEGIDIDDSKDQKPRPTFEFKSDGEFTHTLDITPQNTRYSISGDKITFNEDIAFNHAYFNYSITGTTLILKRTDTFNPKNNISYTENTTIILSQL